MAIKDQFCHPKGLMGKLMLSGMNMGHSPMAKWGLSQIEIPDEGAIADIGCGGGRNVSRLLKLSRSARVYGVDISEASVDKTKAVNRAFLGTRCEVYRAGADRLPFDDASLDLVTAFETVYFWPDLSVCFSEIRRVLKPGGRFAVINDSGDPDGHWEERIPGMKAYTAEDLGGYMKGAGFSDIRIATDKFKICVDGMA